MRGIRGELELAAPGLLHRGQRAEADDQRSGEHGQQQHRADQCLAAAQHVHRVLLLGQALPGHQPRAALADLGQPEGARAQRDRGRPAARRGTARRQHGRARGQRDRGVPGPDPPQEHGRLVNVVIVVGMRPAARLRLPAAARLARACLARACLARARLPVPGLEPCPRWPSAVPARRWRSRVSTEATSRAETARSRMVTQPAYTTPTSSVAASATRAACPT